MELNWAQSILYGLVAGLTDILPVSAQAHRVLLCKLYGVSGGMELMDLLVRLGVAGALYCCCLGQMVRIRRALALARVPKRRRKRPLDERSLMDFRMLRTMLVPVVLAVLLYRVTVGLQNSSMVIAAMLFVNGLVLYIPQFLPGGNRDSRTLSRVEGLLMGLGGGLGTIPGLSSLGLSVSIGSMCGVERSFGLNMALLMDLGLSLGLLVQDGIALIQAGAAGLGFVSALRCVLTGVTAFVGAMAGVWVLRRLVREHGFGAFGFYCMGLALFVFILNLLA